MQSINIFLFSLITPVIVGIVLKILSSTKYKDNILFHRGWMYAFGTFTFYGVMFLAYGELLIFITNLRYIDLADNF